MMETIKMITTKLTGKTGRRTNQKRDKYNDMCDMIIINNGYMQFNH